MDLIKREDAIDAVYERIKQIGYTNDPLVLSIRQAIRDLPSAERKTGRWMFSPDHAEGICTVCQYKIYGRPYQGHYLIVPYNFCPNCGAYMQARGEQDVHNK